MNEIDRVEAIEVWIYEHDPLSIGIECSRGHERFLNIFLKCLRIR